MNDELFTSQNYESETGLISFPARIYDADLLGFYKDKYKSYLDENFKKGKQ